MENLNDQLPGDQYAWTEEQLAQQLGITQQELQSAGYTIEKDAGDDGAVYNYYLRFADTVPRQILRKISGLDKDNRVLIKANYEDDTF